MNIVKNNGYADLHIHTVYSDGMYSPEELVATAVARGLSAISVTDHDGVEGIPRVIEAAHGKDLEIIPGIEVSSAVGDKEIHLLGYFIDWQAPELAGKLEKMKKNRIGRMREMLGLLREKGMKAGEREVMDQSFVGTTGRLHLAHVMVSTGFVRTIAEAFNRYIGNGRPCFVGHKRFDFTKAIDMIKTAGGVPVLAHPGSSGVDEYIPELIKAGLRGIEVYHSRHTSSDSGRYMKIAEENGLIITGGSDCHGLKKERLLLGTVSVSREVVEDLRAESEKIRRERNG